MFLPFRSSVVEELEAVNNYLLHGVYLSGLSKWEKANLRRKCKNNLVGRQDSLLQESSRWWRELHTMENLCEDQRRQEQNNVLPCWSGRRKAEDTVIIFLHGRVYTRSYILVSIFIIVSSGVHLGWDKVLRRKLQPLLLEKYDWRHPAVCAVWQMPNEDGNVVVPSLQGAGLDFLTKLTKMPLYTA